jgi:hypothetical protein
LDNSHGQPGQATGNKVERTKKVVSRPGAGSLSREVASSEEEQEHHANKKNNDKKQREQQVVVVPAGDSENKEK